MLLKTRVRLRRTAWIAAVKDLGDALRIGTYSIVIVSALALTGCGDEDDPISPAEPNLYGVTWKLIAIRPVSSPVSGIPGAEYNIEFSRDGTWAGVNVCNTCGGTYTLGPDSSLSFAAMTCTEMACQPVPPWLGYDIALLRVTRYAFEDGWLKLIFPDDDGDEWELVHTQIE